MSLRTPVAPRGGGRACTGRSAPRVAAVIAAFAAATVLAMLAGCASRGTARAHTPAAIPAAPTLTVATFNLYHDRADWPARSRVAIDGLRALRPDVIALQEVLQDTHLPNQAQALADALGGYSVHFASTDPATHPRRYGNAILTRLPVLAADDHALEPRDDARIALRVRVSVDGHPVDVVATHLHWTDDGDAIRARQLADLLAWRGGDDGAPDLLLGDFNATADAPAMAQVHARFTDAWAARHPGSEPTTLNPAFFEKRARIDHVFAARDAFDVLDARVVLDRADAAGTWPSDHFGVAATLRLRALPAEKAR